jgi:hypothetical protein
MSRAFVKENDLEHAGIDIPERPLSDEPNYVTPNGLKLLNTKIDTLEIEREGLKQKKDDPMIKQKIAILERAHFLLFVFQTKKRLGIFLVVVFY